jgi:glutathione S-transferase
VKVLAVLHHLGQPFEERLVDLTKGETHTPEYLAINPNGLMPTLVEGDFVLWESNAIMQYVAEGTDLLPADARSRAEVTRWMCWQLAHWGSALGTMIFEPLAPHFFPGHQTDHAAVAKAQEKFARFAPVLEKHLTGRQFLVGDRLTVADFSVAGSLVHSEMAQVDLSAYPQIAAWRARVTSLPAWQKALPKMPAMS